jgi:photosynthetic reaction center H subunit
MWTDLGPLLTALAFGAFLAFFAYLVFWLQREGAREGYPLEEERTGRLKPFLFSPPEPKTFRLGHGQGDVTVPYGRRDTRELAATKPSKVNGSPIEPTGDPLVDGIGPGAWADRAKRPELDDHGEPKLARMSSLPDFSIAKRDHDPRGFPVVTLDKKKAGTVTDIWVDKREQMIRYYEATTTGGRKVLIPVSQSITRHASTLFGGRNGVHVDAVTADQLERAPTVGDAASLTLYDEERAVAYLGGGYLYATPKRQDTVV